jgi:hypothetical protein
MWGVRADGWESSAGTHDASKSVMDDGWKLRRNAVVQVAISTARVDGYSVVRRWRTRVGIEV